MHKWNLVFLGVAIAARGASGQDGQAALLDLRPDVRIRFVLKDTRGDRITGNLVTVRGDSITYVTADTTRPLRAALTAIAAMDSSAGRRSIALEGAVLGGGLGAAFGYLTRDKGKPSCDGSACWDLVPGVSVIEGMGRPLVGALVGALAGAVVGTWFSVERWEPIIEKPKRTVQPLFTPRPRGGAVALSVAFR
jgi:hypothetical protein